MTLDQVIVTLENTIAGKQQLLKQLSTPAPGEDPVAAMVKNVTSQFLSVNLTELNNILEHVRLVKQTDTKVQQDASDLSWKANPDRMGGCYTFEEIASSRGWNY